MDNFLKNGLSDEMGKEIEKKEEVWKQAAEFLATLDFIRSEGAVAVIKIDGGRSSQPYTVVIDGGRLHETFREDGADLVRLLGRSISAYFS